MKEPRKPLDFGLETTPKSEPQPATGRRERPAPVQKVQLGARVTESKYRSLKMMAAREGTTVQELLEEAIDEYLAKHK